MSSSLRDLTDAISACSSAFSWQAAISVLKQAEDSCLRADAVVLTATLVACGRARQWASSLQLLSRLQQERLGPDAVALCAAIDACGRGHRWATALSLLREAGPLPKALNLPIFNASLNACARAHRWRPALELLSKMRDTQGCIPPPSEASCNACISACAKAHQWAHALSVFNILKEEQLQPSAVTYGALADALSKAGYWASALELLPELQESKLCPTVPFFGSLVSACEKASCWEAALALQAELPRRRLEPSLIVYNASISALGRGLEWQRSLHLLSEMPSKGLKANTVTINATLASYTRSQCWQAALHLFNEMLFGRVSVMPNAVSFSTTLLACLQAGQWDLVVKLLENMASASVEPDLTGYSKLLFEAEQRSLHTYEASLLERLGAGRWSLASEAPRPPSKGLRAALASATGNAAALQLLLAGQGEEAAKLLQRLPWPPSQQLPGHRGRPGIVSARLWAAGGGLAMYMQKNSTTQPFEVPPEGTCHEGEEGRSEAHFRSGHEKELRLLQYVLRNATPGDACSVCQAAETFATEVLEPWGRWLKVAAGAKAELLRAAAHAAPADGALLEIGTYCGYSAISLALALPGRQVVSLEVDPINAVIARNLVALAGLTQQVDICIGHSSEIIPRLHGRYEQHRMESSETSKQLLPFAFVFMDHKGSRYHEDLASLEEHGLLRAGSVVVADNVLSPGAPLYLWCVAGLEQQSYRTEVVRLREFAKSGDDWMTVSVVKHLQVQHLQGQEHSRNPPEDLLALHTKADKFRVGATAAGAVTLEDWAAFADEMRCALGDVGIEPTMSLLDVGV